MDWGLKGLRAGTKLGILSSRLLAGMASGTGART